MNVSMGNNPFLCGYFIAHRNLFEKLKLRAERCATTTTVLSIRTAKYDTTRVVHSIFFSGCTYKLVGTVDSRLVTVVINEVRKGARGLNCSVCSSVSLPFSLRCL